MRQWMKRWNKAWDKHAFKYGPFRRQLKLSAMKILDSMSDDALPHNEKPDTSDARWAKYSVSLRKGGPNISKDFITAIRCIYERNFMSILMDARITGEVTSPSKKPCRTLKTKLVSLSAARALRPWQLPDLRHASAFGGAVSGA